MTKLGHDRFVNKATPDYITTPLFFFHDNHSRASVPLSYYFILGFCMWELKFIIPCQRGVMRTWKLYRAANSMLLDYHQGRNDDTSMDYACNVALL